MSASDQGRHRGWLRPALAVAAAGILLAVALNVDAPALLHGALAWVARLGVWGPLLYVGVYILACILFLPGSILTLGAGALFGVFKGALIALNAATLGATCAFLIGRYFARDWVAARLEGNPRFRAVDEAVGREGWKIVGLLRLSPIFPFNLLNYAFGLTRVSLRSYFFASWIGMLPGCLMYVYLGALAGDLARLGTGQQTRGTAEWVFYGVGLLATVVATFYVSRVARKALERKV